MNQSSSPTPAPVPGGFSVGERHTAIIGGPSWKGEMWPRPWGVWSEGGYVIPSQKTPDPRSAKGTRSVSPQKKPRNPERQSSHGRGQGTAFPLRLMGKAQEGIGGEDREPVPGSLSPGLAAPSHPTLGASKVEPRLWISTAPAAPYPA